nr:MAG TPA: hypothetical protein [Caudoviricetes sp.]
MKEVRFFHGPHIYNLYFEEKFCIVNLIHL